MKAGAERKAGPLPYLSVDEDMHQEPGRMNSSSLCFKGDLVS
jgi:hypothetical protein